MDEHKTATDVVKMREPTRLIEGAVPCFPPFDGPSFEPPPQGRGTEELAFAPFIYRDLEAGEAGTISICPQVPFRMTRLVVDPHCAPFFVVLDIKLGRNSFLPNASPLPASCFPMIPKISDQDEVEKMVELGRIDVDTAQVGQVVKIDVENRSSERRTFVAWALGMAVA